MGNCKGIRTNAKWCSQIGVLQELKFLIRLWSPVWWNAWYFSKSLFHFDFACLIVVLDGNRYLSNSMMYICVCICFKMLWRFGLMWIDVNRCALWGIKANGWGVGSSLGRYTKRYVYKYMQKSKCDTLVRSLPSSMESRGNRRRYSSTEITG